MPTIASEDPRDRVLGESNDPNGRLARYATASPSYYAPVLQFKRPGGSIRYPMADIVGTARRLADQNGTATDAYSLGAFGRYTGGWANPTQNPYRFGAAWGYITDPSGLLQLGARTYSPDLGRFIQQDTEGGFVEIGATTPGYWGGGRATVASSPPGAWAGMRMWRSE